MKIEGLTMQKFLSSPQYVMVYLISWSICTKSSKDYQVSKSDFCVSFTNSSSCRSEVCIASSLLFFGFTKDIYKCNQEYLKQPRPAKYQIFFVPYKYRETYSFCNFQNIHLKSVAETEKLVIYKFQ